MDTSWSTPDLSTLLLGSQSPGNKFPNFSEVGCEVDQIEAGNVKQRLESRASEFIFTCAIYTAKFLVGN